MFAILTNVNITGTSTNTPTTVASAAPDCNPKREIATATESSKKLLAPIIPAGAAILWGNFQSFAQIYANPNIKNVWMVSGIAINNIWIGLLNIVSPWNENNIIKVKSNPTIVTLSNFFKNTFSK